MKDITDILFNHKVSRIVVKIYFIITIVQLCGEFLLASIVISIKSCLIKNFPFLSNSVHSSESLNFLISHPLLTVAIIAFFILGIAEFIFDNNYGKKTVSYVVLMTIANVILAIPFIIFAVFLFTTISEILFWKSSFTYWKIPKNML